VTSIFTSEQAFHATSAVGNSPARLNARYDMFLRPVASELAGARVLDLGCHNGRFTHAVLAAGAAHVTGVDFDRQYVDVARSIVGGAFPAERHAFEVADLATFLGRAEPGYDVILCLGVLYHTLDPFEILRQCRRLAPRLVVVDSSVAAPLEPSGPAEAAQVPDLLEQPFRATCRERQAFALTGRDVDGRWKTLPSRGLLELWFDELGFTWERVAPDWSRYSAGVGDYRRGLRVSHWLRTGS
jgi:SAM-dependent methyltransferase